MATVSSTTVLTTPGDLTAQMQIYYDKVFLERLQLEQKYSFLATKKKFPKNSGKTVYFTRMTAFTPTTAALTEGANPTGINSTSVNISASVAEYGAFEQVSTLFELTNIDAGLKEMVENFGQFAGESMDTLLGTVICAGATVQTAGSVASLSAIASSNTLSVAEIRRAVLALKTNKAPKFENGKYRAVFSSQGVYELQGDTTAGNWINIGLYNSAENAKMLKDGVIGSLYGVDIVESNNQLSYTPAGSSTAVYSNFVAGKGAIAEIDIAGSGSARIIHKKPGSNDTSNPLDMYSTIGWKVDAYAAKVLNANWVIDIRCA